MHLHCARCTSISRTRSSSMCAERHSCIQSVHAVRQVANSRRLDPRQRRPADRACYVDTAERSSGADWLIVDVDWRRGRLECSSWPDTLVLSSPETDGPWQPACTPRVLERWASGVGRESALTDRGRTCECRWRGGLLHSGSAGLCTTRAMRPHRAANFRGAPFSRKLDTAWFTSLSCS